MDARNTNMSERPQKPTADDLERVAAHLDGQSTGLDEGQRIVAEQIRRDLTWLGSQLDVNVNDEMLLRINARLCDALRRRQRRRQWRKLALPASLAAAVVAAAIILAVIAGRADQTGKSEWVQNTQSTQREARAELDKQLDDEMLQFVARLATVQPDELELQFALNDGGDDDMQILPDNSAQVLD
jgi:hypothetical protein